MDDIIWLLYVDVVCVRERCCIHFQHTVRKTEKG